MAAHDSMQVDTAVGGTGAPALDPAIEQSINKIVNIVQAHPEMAGDILDIALVRAIKLAREHDDPSLLHHMFEHDGSAVDVKHLRQVPIAICISELLVDALPHCRDYLVNEHMAEIAEISAENLAIQFDADLYGKRAATRFAVIVKLKRIGGHDAVVSSLERSGRLV